MLKLMLLPEKGVRDLRTCEEKNMLPRVGPTAEPAEEDIDNKSYHHTTCRRLDRMPYQILYHSILVNKIDRYTYHNVQ
mgnify:CR=1 FL=1